MKQLSFIILFVLSFNTVFSINNSLPPLTATISGGTTVCQNATGVVVTFTGSGGTAPYTFTYNINGGANIVTSPSSGNSITVVVPTVTVGTFTYNLTKVEDSSAGHTPIVVSGTTVFTINTAPTVDFTYNDNLCSGTSIQFTSTVSGSGTSTYSWDFGDSTALSTQANPTHSFTSLGCGTANFTVTLTVIKGGCTVVKTHVISVKQKPDISFSDTVNPFDPFSNCSNASSNPVYSINVGNTSTSTCISSFSINWGDGNTQSNISFPISHTYSLIGAYSMVITAVGNNGCSNTKTYIIKNVSNPLGGINSPGSTQNLCAPTANLQFSISNWGSNSLDTTYTINYGDSTPLLLLTQTQMNSSTYYNSSSPSSSTNYPIPHIYTTSSCPATSFVVTLDVTNACGTTPFTLGNISILTKPTANFTAPINGCVNTSITFTNTTIAGYGQGCVQSSIYTWNFGDGTPTVTTPLSPPQNINHTFTTPGNYTVTLTAQNGCGTTTHTEQICIEPPLIPLFTLNNTSGCTPLNVTATNSTVLTNQCSPPTYLWEVTHTPLYCATTTVSIPNQTTANASYSFTESGTYAIKLTMSNSCGSVFTTQTVTVKKPPTVSIAAIGNFCGSASITPSATVTNCAPSGGTLTYAWSFPGGTPSTASTLNPGTITYPAGGPYTVSLVVTNECGPSNTASQSFTVNVAPTITNTSLSQSICSGSQTTLVNLAATPVGTTFSWSATATAGITGFTPSGTTNTIPVQTISTTNTNPGTVTYIITPTIGTCVGATVNYVVNVIPAPTITTQPTSSSVCIGGTPTLLSVVLNSSSVTPTYQWYSNTSSSTSGGTLIAGATNATYNPPATTAGTIYYYCLISLSSGGCSSLTSSFATVIVNPLPTITSQPFQTQTICQGGSISALTVAYSGGLGTPTYQWYSNATNATTGGSPIGTNSNSYTPSAFNTAGTFYYYVTISLTGNGCGTVSSQSAEIVVVNDPTITTQPLTTQTLCQNATPTALTVVATGGIGTFSYQWFSNTSNSTIGGTPVGTNSPTFTPPTNVVGTSYYYCSVTQTGLNCDVKSNSVTVIINASPTISNQPISSTVCQNGATTTLSFTYTNGVGTPTYQWYSNVNNSNTGGTLLTGETNATFAPPSATIGIIYYYCIITFPSLTGSCGVITTNAASVTINSGAIINQQPTQTQSICVGGTIQNPLSVTYTNGTGTPTYQWYSNTTNSTTGGTPVGTNLPSYTPPAFSAAGTFYYYVVINFSGNGCGSITSAAAEIVVVGDPVVSTQPLPTQTLCQNETPTNLTVNITGGIGTISYQWYSTTTATNTGGTPVGTNAPSFTPPTNSVGTFYYYCAITQSGVACSVNSNSATVIINTSPTIVNQPVSSTVCQNGVVTTLSFTYSNGVGTPTYQWYSNSTNSNTGGTSIPSETNPTYSPTSNTTGVFYYYCVITFPSLIGSCSSVATNVAIVTVNPQSTVDIQPLPTQSICVGGTIQNPLTVSFINGTGTPTYQWYSNTTNATTGGTLVGTNSPNYLPPVFNTVGTFYYYVVISFSGNGCGSITSAVSEIVVVSDPIVSTQPMASQTLCQNSTAAALTVIASGGIGTYSYQWYSNTSNNASGGTLISGATTDTFTPPTTNAGTLYYYCVITQPNGIGCNVSSQISEVNVNIAPTISSNPASSTVCLGQTPTQLTVTYSNGSGAPVYQWYSNTSNSNSGGTAITTEVNPTFNPSSTLAGTFYYYCTITFPSLSGGCEVITSNAATIIIEQIPVISNQATTICSSATFTITPTNSSTDIVPTGTTYTWSTPIISPIGSITGAIGETTPQTSISQTLTNVITTPATATYTVTPTTGSCAGATFTIIVTVNPSTNPNAVKSDITCFGINNGSITTNITGGIPFLSGAPYLISWTGPGAFTSSTPNISNLIPGVYNLSITDAGGCPISNNYTIAEPTDIVITTDTNNNITCFGANNGAIAISVNGGTGAYTYSWTQNTLPYATTDDINNLAPATYVVTVSDANNCGPKTTTFTITEPPVLSVSLLSQTNVDCYGFATGAVTVNTTGGTPIQTSPGVFDYTYSWTGPNGFTSSNQNISNLFAGTYDLTVTDNLGCTKNLPVTITESPEIIINATTTPIICYGDNNATITVTLSGGHAPYQVQWSNLALGLFQNNLAPGNYTITVTDAIGCIKAATINIPSPPIFTVNPVVTNISCFGAHDGSIVLNFVGGIAPVNLVWSDGSPAGITRNNLGPGTYSVIITDSKPCTISRTFTILEPQPLVLSANTTNALDCNNANTGAINLLVSGGTPPFNYSWNNGTTTEDLINIPAGNYAITVTDARGCTKTAQYSITRPNPLTLSINTTTNANCNTRIVTQFFTAQPTGGVPPYILNWSSGTISGANNEFMTTTQNGLVTLTATDAIGCTTNYSLNVAIPILGNPTFGTSSIGLTNYGIYAILDPIQFTSVITGDYTAVVWDFGDGTFSNELNPVHTYLIPNEYYLVTLTVTYPFGCVYISNVALNVEKGYLMVVPTAFTPYNNDGINDTFRPVTKGLKNVHLDVYDTWGSLIYSEVGDTIVGWDGKIKGISSENGNYYAKVSGETFYGTIINENHTFVLIK